MLPLEWAVKRCFKGVAHRLFGDYSIYRIYCLDPSCSTTLQTIQKDQQKLTFGPIERAEIDTATEATIREQSFYCGDGAAAYAARRQDGKIVGVCFFWYGDRYRMRNFWPLATHEAKLVQIITLPEARKQGVAAGLLRFGACDMTNRGFGPLYARIWHSNQPSITAFERAGWSRIATVIEIHLPGRQQVTRMTFGQRPTG